jgi:hypothetical protein
MKTLGVKLTDKMRHALTVAVDRHAVFAGTNHGKFGLFKIPSTVLRALESRRLITVTVGPDGGMMGKPTDEGREAIARGERRDCGCMDPERCWHAKARCRR